MREWPDWRPPDDMLKRRPDLPRFMPGGPENPLGARAIYLGSTLYRIHGSNEPWTIGTQVSSGCIRLRNEDVIDLYSRVKVGTKVDRYLILVSIPGGMGAERDEVHSAAVRVSLSGCFSSSCSFIACSATKYTGRPFSS